VGHSSAMGQIMAAIKEKRIALGIYERESAETSSFQVKVRAVGLRLTRSFPFNDSGPIDRRRTQVLREAKAWQARNKASAQNHGIAADPVATKASTITLGDWCAQYIADADQTMILQTMAAAKQAGREVSDTRLERLRRLCEVPAQFAALVDPMANDKKSIRRERDMLVVCVQQYADGLMLKHPTEITANDLAAMRDECKRRILPGGGRALSDQSINLRLAAIQSVYLRARDTWRHADGTTWWPSDRILPGRLVNRLKGAGRKAQTITDKEWTKVWAQRKNTSPGTLAALLFLRNTAARRSEAAHLHWTDITPPARRGGLWTAHLRDTKTPTGEPNERTIPLLDEGVDALLGVYKIAAKDPRATSADMAAGLKAGLTGLVFGVEADTITQAWDRMRTRAKIKNRRVHDIRHTRITEIANALPLLKAQALSGHKTTAMLARYYHPDAQEIGAELKSAEAAAKPKTRKKSAK
jgi:integrase